MDNNDNAEEITATNDWLADLEKLYAQSKIDQAAQRQKEEIVYGAQLQKMLEFLGIKLSGTLQTTSITLDGITFQYYRTETLRIYIGDRLNEATEFPVNLRGHQHREQLALYHLITELRTPLPPEELPEPLEPPPAKKELTTEEKFIKALRDLVREQQSHIPD